MQRIPNTILKLALHVSELKMERQEKKYLKSRVIDDSLPAKHNVRYGKSKDREHLLDIYYPEIKKKNCPLIINIHGGRLIHGDKTMNEEFCRALAKRDYIVICINYSLIPKVTFPEQIGEILMAYEWICQHQEKIGYNPEAVYVIGESAGALLTVYSAAANANPAFGEILGLAGTGLKIKALGLISGMFYLYKEKFSGTMVSLLFGENYKEEAYLAYIKPKRLLEDFNIPPCFLVTSEEDERKESTLMFNNELEKCGCSHQMHCWGKGEKEILGHKFCVLHPEWEESRRTIEEMVEYFGEV